MKMQLYFAPHTCALASHIALEQAGADYEAVRVDFKTNAQRSPEYMKINPKARVPALVTDRGVLTETPAILAFVAQRYPAGWSGAARRPLRVRAGAGVQQLPVLDRARRARAPHARLPLGRRSRPRSRR